MKYQGVSVEELSKQMEKKPQWIYHVLSNGCGTLKTVSAFAKALKIKAIDLLEE